MRGLSTVKVMFSIPAHDKDEEVTENYRTAATIYGKMKRMMAKNDGIKAANKFDVLRQYGIPFYMRSIKYKGMKIIPMLAFDPFNDVKRMSGTKNPISNQPMMETDDLNEFAHQLVCASPAFWAQAFIEHVFSFVQFR